MALNKLFGKQEAVTAEETSKVNAAGDPAAAVVSPSPEQDTKAVEPTSEKLKQSAEQREKEAKHIVEETKGMADKIEKVADATAVVEKRKLRPEIRPHAFVVMPFGKKKGMKFINGTC